MPKRSLPIVAAAGLLAGPLSVQPTLTQTTTIVLRFPQVKPATDAVGQT
jgi:hypothetical protein